jgi:plasmid stabilization system protein ParE
MKVEWTEQAENDFEKYVNFLAENISHKASASFMEATFDTIEKIRNPLINYQIVDTIKEIRKCKINKSVDLYYKIIDDNCIELRAFFDSRQDSKKLKL